MCMHHASIAVRTGAGMRTQTCCRRVLPARSAPVACVEAAGTVAVLAPRCEAEPTELMAALAARHVHAALILLDRALALGARLGVGDDPREVLALSTVLDVPLFHRLAVHRPVSLLLACEAERPTAFAHHVQRPAPALWRQRAGAAQPDGVGQRRLHAPACMLADMAAAPTALRCPRVALHNWRTRSMPGCTAALLALHVRRHTCQCQHGAATQHEERQPGGGDDGQTHDEQSRVQP
jgi:hypothetical protein